MTTKDNDSTRVKEIRVLVERRITGHYSAQALVDINWLLERDKEHREQIAALVPAAEYAIGVTGKTLAGLENASRSFTGTSDYRSGNATLTKAQFDKAQAAVKALEGK